MSSHQLLREQARQLMCEWEARACLDRPAGVRFVKRGIGRQVSSRRGRSGDPRMASKAGYSFGVQGRIGLPVWDARA
jgi:hypothetical protein